MKPAPVDYVAPDSLDSALALLGEHGFDAKILAGGQSLVPILSFRLAQPAVLIDLNRIDGLAYVEESAAGGLKIGAMTRQSRIEREPLVAGHAPLLHEAMPLIAHPQIRNRGTVGGSLAHADPAAELPVVAVALGARFRIVGAAGERWVEASDFYVGLMTTDLAAEEILVEVELPPSPPRTGYAFVEIARRHGDYAHAGVAASVSLDGDGGCRDARLVYLSLGETPMTASRAAGLLVSEGLGAESIRAAAELAASEEIEPTTDIHATAEYKRHLARVVTERALGRARQRAESAGAAA